MFWGMVCFDNRVARAWRFFQAGRAFALLFFVVGGKNLAHVAQLVEHVLGKDEVSGSIPLMGSRRALAGVVLCG